MQYNDSCKGSISRVLSYLNRYADYAANQPVTSDEVFKAMGCGPLVAERMIRKLICDIATMQHEIVRLQERADCLKRDGEDDAELLEALGLGEFCVSDLENYDLPKLKVLIHDYLFGPETEDEEEC